MQDHAHNIVIKPLPSSRERLPLFIVGDVHGCARELADLLRKAKEKVPRFQLVLVGDLFTKGPDPVGVFELIQEHQALCIKGNHDWALWASLLQAQKRGLQSLPEHTRQTLHLIRYHRRAIFDLLVSLPHAYTSTVVPAMQRKGWEEEYPLIIVHAGIDPTRGLLGSSERMLLTARYVRWEQNGDAQKKLVLVPSGHRAEVLAAAAAANTQVTSFTSASLTQTGMLLSRPPRHATQGGAPGGGGTLGTSAGQQASVSGGGTTGHGVGSKETSGTQSGTLAPLVEKFRWHELHQGPDLIVFGHDAKQGLFRKTLPSGRPICVGVDTGCTYGRALTGYFPEFDDAIQVPARRTYFDIVKNVILLRAPHPRVAV